MPPKFFETEPGKGQQEKTMTPEERRGRIGFLQKKLETERSPEDIKELISLLDAEDELHYGDTVIEEHMHSPERGGQNNLTPEEKPVFARVKKSD
jgi:hypothetical protein